MTAWRLCIAWLLTAAALAAGTCASAQVSDKKEGPSISAPYAILMEAEQGSVLFEQGADTLIYPASLAKLMTAEYIFHLLKEGKIQLTDEYRISENAWRKGGAPSGGSTMFAEIHSKVSVDNLLRGMIVQSANDACIAVAEALAGNEAEFGRKLTARARELGFEKSTFTNSSGLPDPDQQVTARELGKLARHIINTYPDFYKLFAEPEFTWNKIRQYNRNPLLKEMEGVDGLKTGYTSEAGYGLVASAVRDGLRLIVVVSGLKTPNQRATDAKKLLEWGFRNFEGRVLFAEGQIIGSAKVYGGEDGYVPLKSPEPVRVMVPKNGSDRLLARIVYTGPVPAPVKEGQQIGHIKVWRNDSVVLEMPLQAADSVGVGNLPQRALDAVTEMVIALFRAGFDRL